MKRIIGGKAYNTETAQHIATAKYSYEKRRGEEWSGSWDLYRTKGGAFFLVRQETPEDGSPWDLYPNELWKKTMTEFFPLTYDNAYAFVRGEAQADNIELLVDGIFPSIPEAVDDTSEDTAK